MTSLDRAKRFLHSKGRTLALVTIPLAALTTLATPAKATTTFAFTSANQCNGSTYNANSTLSSGTCSGSLLPTEANGVNGATLSGNLSASAIAGGASFGLLWTWVAAGNDGFFSGPLPLAWDFTIAPGSGNPYNWTLDFDFVGTTTDVTESGSGSLSTEFQGTDVANLNGSANNLTVTLTVTTIAAFDNQQLQAAILPDSSFDVNGVPEPATLVLLAAPLGYLMFRRQRKQ